MARAQKKNVADREMYFISGVSAPSGIGLDLHSKASEQLSKKAKEIREDWQKVMEELQFIIAESEKSAQKSTFSMDEIKVSLGFSAKGKLAFIAEAGVEASIEVTFRKK